MPASYGRGRRRYGRSRTKKSVPRWTAFSGSMAVATGAIGQLTLFAATDAGLASLVEGECTCLRIVGQIGVIPSTALASSYGLGLLKQSNTITNAFGGFGDPIVSQQLIERDWMHVQNGDFNLNSLANGLMRRHEIDVRVKRRLKEDECLRLVVSNAAAGGDLTITIDARILIVIRA